eukprot:3355693-Prymnesium_polylepis.1
MRSVGSDHVTAHSTTRDFWPPLSLAIGSQAMPSTIPKRPRRARHSASLAPAKRCRGGWGCVWVCGCGGDGGD